MTDNQAERLFKMFQEASMQEIAETGQFYRCRVRWRHLYVGGRINIGSLRIGLLAMGLLVLAACQATGERACAGDGYETNSPEAGDCGAARSDTWSQRAMDEAQSGFDRRSPRDR